MPGPNPEWIAYYQQLKSSRIPKFLWWLPTPPTLPLPRQDHSITHNILHLSERTKQAFPQPPIIAYSRPKTLQDLLVRANLAPRATHHPGNTPCGRSRCKTCPNNHRQIHYTLRSAATSKSKDVVYLIQ